MTRRIIPPKGSTAREFLELEVAFHRFFWTLLRETGLLRFYAFIGVRIPGRKMHRSGLWRWRNES